VARRLPSVATRILRNMRGLWQPMARRMLTGVKATDAAARYRGSILATSCEVP
jgi:hypothetical protein